jgi:hypothetical protein
VRCRKEGKRRKGGNIPKQEVAKARVAAVDTDNAQISVVDALSVQEHAQGRRQYPLVVLLKMALQPVGKPVHVTKPTPSSIHCPVWCAVDSDVPRDDRVEEVIGGLADFGVVRSIALLAKHHERIAA